MEIVQFYPNRITITTQRDKSIIRKPKKSLATKKKEQDFLNLAKRKSSVNLSSTSKRQIRDSINSMYVLSKPRTLKLPNGKFIYNYRQSFITLTLPSKQIHSDVEIKKCLNNFLTSLRNSIKIQNYVWKAELQKNENIHFHIVVDKYCSYQAVRHYWNKAINTLGYVDRYQKKFMSMDIKEYASIRKKSIDEVRKAYVNGVRSKWSIPNSVDVVSVRTERDVSNYLSKYFAKSDDSNLDGDRIASFGRVWSRSTSLSSLKYINKFEYNEIKEYLNNLLLQKKASYFKKYDYCSIIYLKISALTRKSREFFNFILRNNATRYNYPFPVPLE